MQNRSMGGSGVQHQGWFRCEEETIRQENKGIIRLFEKRKKQQRKQHWRNYGPSVVIGHLLCEFMCEEGLFNGDLLEADKRVAVP